MQQKEIERLLSSKLDDAMSIPMNTVLENLGQTVFVPSSLDFAPSGEDFVKAAKTLIVKNKQKICEACWQNEYLRDFMQGGKTYLEPELVLLVVDILLAILGKSSCGWAAIYLVRSGLVTVCPPKPATDEVK